MNKLTLGDVKNPLKCRIAQAIGVPASDPKFTAIINESVERLIYSGKYWGLVGRFRFYASDGCITLPAQIATIEAANVCNNPVTVHDQWYEFLGNGIVPLDEDDTTGSGPQVAVYRGHFPTFSDIDGMDKQLKLICDETTDVGKQVLVLGYDQNGNWIRTEQNGVVQDGELVTLAQSTNAPTNHYFSAITGIQAPDGMDGQWFLYEYQPSTDTMRLIGQYDYDNIRPNFARYLIPSVQPSEDGSPSIPVEIAGKLEYKPVQNDSDYIMISSMAALKEMAMAVNSAEHEADSVKRNQIIIAGTNVARGILDQQLDHYLGSGRKIGIKVSSTGFEGDIVPFVI